MADEFSVWLDNLKSRLDIADVVGSYVALTRKGSRLWACCPFHHEKTPSFCVDESRQNYHCYGCHVGGDAISFVMAMENVDFKDAVKMLAQRYNLPPMPTSKGGGDFAKVKRHKDKLYAMMRDAAQHYHANLMSKDGDAARAYLSARGITASTIMTFGLGYSTGYNQLVSFLRGKGYSVADMAECGLTDSKNDRVYDAMAGRVIVPIINNLKQVIAFGGRVIDKDKQPKYKNTRESVLFNKSRELFGQHSVKKLRMEEPVTSIVMVEGYMDVISLYQAGVRNAMASMGTALTEEQAKLLKRYCDKIFICYDGDAAGQKATLRGLDILYNADLDVRVMALPDGMDPDEYVRRYGKEGYVTQMMRALPLFEYKLRELATHYDLTIAEDRGKYAVEAMTILRALSNPAQVEAYLPLVTEFSGIGRETLYRQYNTGVLPQPKPERPKTQVSRSAFDRAVRFVLYALYGGMDDAQCDVDLSQYLTNPDQQRLYDALRESGVGALTLDDLQAADNNPEVREIFEEGSRISDEQAPRYFRDCLDRIVRTTYTQRFQELSRAIDAEQDEEARVLLLTQLAQLTKSSKKR